MSHCYPDINLWTGKKGDQTVLYYVEFERGGRKGEFTLFKRQWMYSKEDWEEMTKNAPDDLSLALMSNEVHPWNIFTATYGPLGSMPDENWIKFMVDALNEKVLRTKAQMKASEKYNWAIGKVAENLAEEIDQQILDELIEEHKKST